ncbi:MAG: oxalate/formate MFS antiporter [Alphaproteobacteria bacterium]|nr:oxalate/formate MFS antiporter [Alphaproteobacteria bacterium]
MAQGREAASGTTRWVQLALGVIAMMAISSPQYVWTLFTKPLQTALGSDLPTIQVTISLLIVLQTWLSPAQGWLVDRFGPRALVSFGAALTGASWVLSAHATSVPMLYLAYGGLGGIGTGIVYVGVVGLMVKWFPEKRGFATGMVAAGYGFGAIATTFPIDAMIKASGYQHTMVVFGLILGGIGLVAALGLSRPPETSDHHASAASGAAARSYAPGEMLRTPVFWLLFVMMTMMSTGGLMVITQFAGFAKEFGVTEVLVFGMASVPLALTIDRVTNGFTRPFFGWVSDRIGRENTMGLAFFLEALAILLWLSVRDNAVAFVLLSGLVFFAWGEIFSLFPSTLTDTFGTRHCTTNYGFLYMAQGVGSVLGAPVAAQIHDMAGSWVPVFALLIALDVATALLALFVLKPMRRQFLDAAPALPAAVAAAE